MSAEKNTQGTATSHAEIERKWVIKKIPEITFNQVIKVKQGYLNLPGTFRFRSENDGIGTRYFQQIKKRISKLERLEISMEIPKEIFNLYWEALKDDWLEKTRWIYIDKKGNKLEFDEFHGKLDGLFILECEFASVKKAKKFVVPEWIEVSMEITEDKEFSCKSLARYGAPLD